MTIALLGLGINKIAQFGAPVSLPALWDRGFGQVSVDALYENGGFIGPTSAISMVLLANLPQLLLSLLYTGLNGMWTAMLVGVEWNSYGTKRKSLRTSCPKGKQRRTYWLSLPLVSDRYIIKKNREKHDSHEKRADPCIILRYRDTVCP